MKVSVIILAHNEEAHIGACLQRFMEQTIPPDEIIVVDNNSTDSTAKIARKFKVRIISEKKQGIVFARNTGFTAAKGDVIARTDADTLVSKNWVETIHKTMDKKYKSLCALSGMSVYPEDMFSTLFPGVLYIYFRYYLKFFYGHYQMYGHNCIVTKKMWNKIKNEVCTDSDVQEDLDLTYHINHYGHIYFDRKLLVSTSLRRRAKNPLSFWFEYPFRNILTMLRHEPREII